MEDSWKSPRSSNPDNSQTANMLAPSAPIDHVSVKPESFNFDRIHHRHEVFDLSKCKQGVAGMDRLHTAMYAITQPPVLEYAPSGFNRDYHCFTHIETTIDHHRPLQNTSNAGAAHVAAAST